MPGSEWSRSATGQSGVPWFLVRRDGRPGRRPAQLPGGGAGEPNELAGQLELTVLRAESLELQPQRGPARSAGLVPAAARTGPARTVPPSGCPASGSSRAAARLRLAPRAVSAFGW